MTVRTATALTGEHWRKVVNALVFSVACFISNASHKYCPSSDAFKSQTINQAQRSAAWRKNQTPSGRYATRFAFQLSAGARPRSVLRLLPTVYVVIYFNLVSTLRHQYIYLCWIVLMCIWTGYANTYNKNWCLVDGLHNLYLMAPTDWQIFALLCSFTPQSGHEHQVQHQASGLDQITHVFVFRDNWTTKNLAVAFGWVVQDH